MQYKLMQFKIYLFIEVHIDDEGTILGCCECFTCENCGRRMRAFDCNKYYAFSLSLRSMKIHTNELKVYHQLESSLDED